MLSVGDGLHSGGGALDAESVRRRSIAGLKSHVVF